jgi:PAS domain S-box-containing protein
VSIQPIYAASFAFAMNLESWLDEAFLVPPSSIVGFAILALFALGAVLLVIAMRGQFRSLGLRSWMIIAVFGFFAFIIGSVDQIPLSSIIPAGAQFIPAGQSILLAPIGLAIFILIGALINPAAAFLVALAFGIGRGLWATHEIYDFFIPVFVATFVAAIMYQQYAGRLYSWLRIPAIAGFLGAFLQVFLVVLAMWATGSIIFGGLLSFDRAMDAAFAQAPFLIANAIFASLLVWLILALFPDARKHTGASRSPLTATLNRKLVTTYLMLIGLMGVLLLVMGYAIARQTSLTSMTGQIEEQTEIAADSIGDYLDSQEAWLNWIGANGELSTILSSADGPDSQTVDSLAERFDRAFIVKDDSYGVELYPDFGAQVDLSQLDSRKYASVINGAASGGFIVSGDSSGEPTIDFVSPLPAEFGVGPAIVGQVTPATLAEAIPSSMVPPDGSEFYIIDSRGELLLGPALTDESDISGEESPDSSTEDAAANAASQNIIYSTTIPGAEWTLSLVVPEETLIKGSLGSLGRGALLFAGAVILSASVLFMVVRTISESLNQIADSTLQAARTQSDVSVTTNGHDEIDGLVRAVRRLQIMHEQRLEEQRLLLDVSDQVSRSFDLNEAMPVLLAGLKRGTYATGARAVMTSADARTPLRFSTGPTSKSMAILDNAIVRILRAQSELILRTPEEVQETLGATGNNNVLPNSIAAVNLESRDIHAVLYVWRDSPHFWEESQLRLLRTLAGYASTLIENAALLAKVEGSRRRMAAILGSTADAVVATDDNGKVLLFNSAMEGYFGVPARKAIGRNLESVIEAQPLVEALRGGASPQGRLEVTTKDGRILDCALARFNGSSGLEAGKVAVLHDITHIKEIDALKSEFVSNVSHDLRSPLAYMTNYAALIPTQGQLEPKQQEWLDRIVSGIEEMTSLIETLLDLQRLDAGVALQMIEFKLDNLIKAVVGEYRQHASEQGISIELHMGSDYPPITGDPDLIRQSLRNLLSNAIKYAPDSGPVAVSVRTVGNEILISVEDRGPGIPEYEVSRVFEMFYRSPAARVANRKGKGLGLAFVKSTAERHGGSVWCESQLGKGSKFIIALPIEVEGARARPSLMA